MSKFLTEAKERWNCESPDFFKKIRSLSIVVGTAATSVWITNQTMGLELHEYILVACKYLIAACAAAGLTSQLTKQNPQ
jgi:hypothetical protein